jgi:hypothetical protein
LAPHSDEGPRFSQRPKRLGTVQLTASTVCGSARIRPRQHQGVIGAEQVKHSRDALCLALIRRENGPLWCAHRQTPTLPVVTNASGELDTLSSCILNSQLQSRTFSPDRYVA